MEFRIVEQLDHQLPDMTVEKMIPQRGKRQETRTRHHMDAVRGAAQADEWRIHFPFGGGIEKGKLFPMVNIPAGNHLQILCIENHIGVTGMIERGEFAHFGVPVTPNLDGITICSVNYFFCWDLTNDVTLFVCLFRNQTSKF